MENEYQQFEQTDSQPETDAITEVQIIPAIAPKASILLGTLAGVAAALVGASIWAGVTIVTEFQIGWMAVGVGFLVGIAIRFAGKGSSMVFGIVGAALALFGCLLGNVISVCYFASVELEMEFAVLFWEVIKNPEAVVELLKVTFSPMDLLFYAIAIYEGFRLSIMQKSA